METFESARREGRRADFDGQSPQYVSRLGQDRVFHDKGDKPPDPDQPDPLGRGLPEVLGSRPVFQGEHDEQHQGQFQRIAVQHCPNACRLISTPMARPRAGPC